MTKTTAPTPAVTELTDAALDQISGGPIYMIPDALKAQPKPGKSTPAQLDASSPYL